MFKLLVFFFTGLFFFNAAAPFSSAEQDRFLKSFFDHYECSPEGRYTHEYHPFLLEWTSQSLDTLESYLEDGGISLDGRLVIMGYEEGAVPRYYTDYSRSSIDDEAARHNRSGWSLKLHNRFGFMSGFLFKNLPPHPVFHHIDAHLVPIFDDRADIFQEYAFGQALPLMRTGKDIMESYIASNDTRKVFSLLERFWTALYKNAFTVGNSQIAGTQDILFSVQYMKHLMRSKLELRNFYTGPDITYPIEISCKQDRTATMHAQEFVRRITKKFTPINNEPTVYVFCSFVDGVGKSTMLGNVKNWLKHGDNVDEYGHVDNSSSQFAELFKFADNTFIADLPAQVSHFTYKPDGYVFVDMHAQASSDAVAEIEAFVQTNKKKLKDDFAGRKEGFKFPTQTSQADPLDAFIYNLYLLKKNTTSDWIGFEYKGKPYLFRDTKVMEYRCYEPIATVRSEGLKNIDAEQMIFSHGIRMPLAYDVFIKDLRSRLQQQGIKHVVFVDFVSMYPRSSRENIRINYVLQQLAHLDQHFDLQHSWYRDFSSGGQLLYMLKQPDLRASMIRSLKAEGIIRLLLFKQIITGHNTTLDGVAIKDITEQLGSEWGALMAEEPIETCVKNHVYGQIGGLEKLYGLSKSYINVECTRLCDLVTFSNYLQNFMRTYVGDEFTKSLWQPLGLPRQEVGQSTEAKKAACVVTTKGAMAHKRGQIDLECKTHVELEKVLKPLRVCWGMIIKQLLLMGDGRIVENSLMPLPNQLYLIPYQAVSNDKDLYALQPFFKSELKSIPGYCYDQLMIMDAASFAPTAFTDFNTSGRIFGRISFDVLTSSQGFFGYGVVDSSDQQDSYGFTTATWIAKKYKAKVGASQVMTTSQLWDEIQQDKWWRYDRQQRLASAQKNGSFDIYKKAVATIHTIDPKKAYLPGSNKIYLGEEKHAHIARIVVLLLASLDLMIKDPDAFVAIRQEEHEDFVAAVKLIENIVLPEYCNIIFKQPLFDDYSQLKPLVLFDD